MCKKLIEMSSDDSGSSFVDSEIESADEELEETNGQEEKSQNEEEEDDDELIRTIKMERNKKRNYPPTITCEDDIGDIALHPARNMIAVASMLGDVLLYEYNNEENNLLNTLELHVQACRAVEFDAEGNTMYTAAKDKAIMVTDVETGKLKRCYERSHEEPIYSLMCLDNDKILTGDDGGTVKLWDMRKATPVFSINIGDDYVSDMITNDSQKYVVCSSGDGVLTTIDLKKSKIFTRSEDYDSELTCMGLFRSDSKLLVGSSKGKLYMFNWKEFGLHSDEYVGQKTDISCMIPITQNIVVTSGEDGVLRAAHMFPQRQLGVVGHHDLPVECLDISHDGEYIASSSNNNDVKFWNISYFESIDNLIDMEHKPNKKKDMANNLPSSCYMNSSNFFSGLL